MWDQANQSIYNRLKVSGFGLILRKRNKIISIKRVDGLSASNGGGSGDVGVVGLKGTQELGEDEDEDGIGMKKEVVGCLLLLQESLESL
ncbi:hypothetical protein RUM43_009652 [Polyplax serrata]|uniref:Uncharacterized protein n=1 Tax=Polyplax serrata TaxID=468196 RepID=A0AAN8PKA4_POLSC